MYVERLLQHIRNIMELGKWKRRYYEREWGPTNDSTK